MESEEASKSWHEVEWRMAWLLGEMGAKARAWEKFSSAPWDRPCALLKNSPSDWAIKFQLQKTGSREEKVEENRSREDMGRAAQDWKVSMINGD